MPKEYEDLNKEEKKAYEAEVDKSLQPFVDKKILKKTKYPHIDRPIWQSFAGLNKLIDTVDLAIKEKWWDPKSIMINWQQVLLSFLPFIIFFKEYSDESEVIEQRLEEYRQELINKQI